MRKPNAKRLESAIENAVRNNDLRELKAIVREQLLDSDINLDLLLAQNDARAHSIIREQLGIIVSELSDKIPVILKQQFVDEFFNDMLGYGPIQPLMDNDQVTEIMVNRFDQVWVEVRGRLELTDVKFRDEQNVREVIERMIAPLGRRIDESSPMVDARLPDGSRLNAVLPPLAINGACFTIRRFRQKLGIEDLVNLGTLSEREVQFLDACVRGKQNIIISGGAGSGKTTLLNCISRFIPAEERIITIEDAAELQLQREHVVRLESRPPNIEGRGEITIRQLVINSLRMRPDRIIVGECRAGEAFDMLQAMNTGHEGSASTLHANSPIDALTRLENMALMAGNEMPYAAIREMIARAVDVVIQTERLIDGTRKITQISEVVGLIGGQIQVEDIFKFEVESISETGQVIGQLKPTGYKPKLIERLKRRGISIDEEMFGEMSTPGLVYRPNGERLIW